MFLLTHPKGERISTEAQLDSLIKTITYRDSTDGELRILGSTRRGLLQRAEANAVPLERSWMPTAKYPRYMAARRMDFWFSGGAILASLVQLFRSQAKHSLAVRDTISRTAKQNGGYRRLRRRLRAHRRALS